MNLPFLDSLNNLEVGQNIECRVTGFADKKPYLVLVNANPSLIAFMNKGTVFGTDESLQAWLEYVFTEEYLKDAAQLYEEKDGRWICLVSKEIEKIIYSLLLFGQDNKEEILTALCNGWLNTIEHSPFMVKLSGKEKHEYSSWLAHSIEVCEDFKDALSLPDKEKKVTEGAAVAGVFGRLFIFGQAAHKFLHLVVFLFKHLFKGLDFLELDLARPVNLIYGRALRIDGPQHRLFLRRQASNRICYVVNLLFHRYKNTKFI